MNLPKLRQMRNQLVDIVNELQRQSLQRNDDDIGEWLYDLSKEVGGIAHTIDRIVDEV